MSLQSCCSPVQCDTLKIYNGIDSSGTLLKTVCGTTKDPVVSSSNKLYLEFKSDGTIPNYGFTASYITKGPGMMILPVSFLHVNFIYVCLVYRARKQAL